MNERYKEEFLHHWRGAFVRAEGLFVLCDVGGSLSVLAGDEAHSLPPVALNLWDSS